MIRPLQPQFKIRVYHKGKKPDHSDAFSSRGDNYSSEKYSYMDIEDCVEYGVTYEEQASLLNTLTFTVDKHGDILLHRFSLGQWIVLYGGYYSDNNSGVRKVFTGTVTRLKTTFSDNGVIRVTIEAMTIGYTKFGKDTAYNFSYPDKNSSREFVKGKTSISLQELVVGLIESAGAEIGEVKLPSIVNRTVYTEKKPIRQNNLSDWKFLSTLADKNSCYLWMDTVDGKEKVYFVDKKKVTNTYDPMSLSFLYPLQGTEGITEANPGEIQRFPDPSWNRPRLIRDVVVDEDISMAYAVSRTAMYLDKDTGEYKEVTAQVLTDEKGNRITVFYELDQDRVAYIDKVNPKLADQIRSGASQLVWSNGGPIEKETPEFTRYYYKKVQNVDENIPVFDNAFFGIYVTATCNQDLDIRSQRSYNIRGILRYSTTAKSERYFLRGLKHIWGREGSTTELDFIL